MLTNIRKRSEGFTIVETLIVLAIAGLIILIVLLAVPALQRNSRNTNIKNDASAVAGAITEYGTANGGGLPTGVANTSTSTVSATGAAGTNTTTGKVQASDTITVVTAAPTSITQGTISVWLGHNCAGNPGRATAIYYPLELTSTTTVQCLES